MAVRRIHNQIAEMVVKLPRKEIDEINRLVDDPEMLRKYGRYHRRYWGHNWNATARDSRIINRGNAQREKARRVHIIVDTDPKIKRMVKRLEIMEKLRR